MAGAAGRKTAGGFSRRVTLVTNLVSFQARGNGKGDAAIRWDMTSRAALSGPGRLNSLEVLGVIELRVKTDKQRKTLKGRIW